MENSKIGNVISSARRNKGLTQRELAARLNVTDKAVSKWERDIARPDINTIPKLANILEVPVEELLNIQFRSKPNETTIDSDEIMQDSMSSCDDDIHERESFKATARIMLIKGLIGFVAGFLFAFFTSADAPMRLGFSVLVGLFFSGVPYGWEILSSFVGQWIAIGSIPVMIIIFLFKFVGALIIGWVAYPLSLFFTLMKAHKRGSVARKVWTGFFIAFICLLSSIALVIICDVIKEKTHADDIDGAQTIVVTQNEYYQIDHSYFTENEEALVNICEKALESSKTLELEDLGNGFPLLSPSAIKAVYFLKVKDPSTEHYDSINKVQMTNAVAVLTSYYVNIWNTVNRDEWTLFVYPDFTVIDGEEPFYAAEKEHNNGLLGEDVNEIYTWICEEYDDMDVYELPIPSKFLSQ